MPLVKISPPEFDVELCIAYATEDNFTGHALYKNPYCYLHADAANALKKTIELAAKKGLRLKIFDAFRPLEVQQLLWDKYPDPEFVSNPQTGKTPHCRGIAVDLTLIDAQNQELEMGTEFDAFTPLSHHGNKSVSKQAQDNRDIFIEIMTNSGWLINPNEWWHYQLANHEKYEKLTDSLAQTNML